MTEYSVGGIYLGYSARGKSIKSLMKIFVRLIEKISFPFFLFPIDFPTTSLLASRFFLVLNF